MSFLSPKTESTLKGKEIKEFRALLKCVDNDSFKKGIRSADAILAKYPTHYETLSLKTYCNFKLYMETLKGARPADADIAGFEASLRQCIGKDMFNALCWHVMALFLSALSRHADALKAYRQALRNSPAGSDTNPLLRELASLHLQLRDYPELVDVMQQLLAGKPGHRPHWIGLALALHLGGQPHAAVAVINALKAASGSSFDPKDGEVELDLYLAHLHLAQNQPELALTVLQRKHHPSAAQDEWTHLELRHAALTALNRDARAEAQALYLRNPRDPVALRRVLASSLVANPSLSELDLLRKLQVEQPNGAAANALLAALPVDAPETAELYRTLLSEACARGRPAVFFSLPSPPSPLLPAVLEELIAHPPAGSPQTVPFAQLTLALYHMHTVPVQPPVLPSERTFPLHHYFFAPEVPLHESLTETILSNSKSSTPSKDPNLSTIANNNNTQNDNYNSKAKNTKNPPSVHTLSFLSSLSLLCTSLPPSPLLTALPLLLAALQHTPTLTDAYVHLARLLKRLSLPRLAAEAMDAARQLDLSDRFLNSKAVRYWLRCGEVARARDLAKLFTRAEQGVDEYMAEMQGNWYQLELARAYWAEGVRRKRDGGEETLEKSEEVSAEEARKRAEEVLLGVERNFAEYGHDQLDFHLYCIRKNVLLAYLDLAKETKDKLEGHRFANKSAEMLCALAVEAGRLDEAEKWAERLERHFSGKSGKSAFGGNGRNSVGLCLAFEVAVRRERVVAAVRRMRMYVAAGGDGTRMQERVTELRAKAAGKVAIALEEDEKSMRSENSD